MAEEQRLDFSLHTAQALCKLSGSKDGRPLIDGKSLPECRYQRVDHLSRAAIRSLNFSAQRSGRVELAVWREPLGNCLDTFLELFGSQPQLLPTISKSLATVIRNGGRTCRLAGHP